MVNTLYCRPIFLLTYEIRLLLSTFSPTVSTKICLSFSSAMNLGPAVPEQQSVGVDHPVMTLVSLSKTLDH